MGTFPHRATYIAPPASPAARRPRERHPARIAAETVMVAAILATVALIAAVVWGMTP